ncbi:unnamed protein product [Orchesella dallaii]|uniref:Phospholipid scramblase n=1 Tax=Orchesella dallaii TaxID=48710 RepID=A0ABP1QHY0_9HEXA
MYILSTLLPTVAPLSSSKFTWTSTSELDAALRSQNPNATRVFECTASVKGCFCCCMPTSRSWQNMVLKWGEDEVLNFSYRPQLWTYCRKKSRTVDIFVPQRCDSIGSVIYGESFVSDAVIIDHISRSVFFTSWMDPIEEISRTLPRLMIKDKQGNEVAIAQAIKGIGRFYTDFELIFSPFNIIESASIKAILAVAFNMWVITRKESIVRELYIFLLMLLCFLVSIFTYVFV